MSPSLQPATIAVDRVAFRALAIELLLATTTSQAVITRLEQFFDHIGLTSAPVYFIYFHDGAPHIGKKNLVVDATNRTPINSAATIIHYDGNEAKRHLEAGRSAYDFLGATYFSNPEAAEVIRFSLLKLPPRESR